MYSLVFGLYLSLRGISLMPIKTVLAYGLLELDILEQMFTKDLSGHQPKPKQP